MDRWKEGRKDLGIECWVVGCMYCRVNDGCVDCGMVVLDG